LFIPSLLLCFHMGDILLFFQIVFQPFFGHCFYLPNASFYPLNSFKPGLCSTLDSVRLFEQNC
jgi:hypothetical protein